MSTIAELADDIVKRLGSLPDRPLVLFGHSMGSLAAAEVAANLVKSNPACPAGLIASGHRAPHHPNERRLSDMASDGDFIEVLKSLEGTPQEILHDPAFVSELLPILKADIEACDRYVPSFTDLPCAIVAYGGLSDADVSREDLHRWRELRPLSFTARMFPGGHFYFGENEHLFSQILSRDVLALTAAKP